MNITIITDDEFTEVDETISLYLSSGAGVFLSPFARAEVVIFDDDGRYSHIRESVDSLCRDGTNI